MRRRDRALLWAGGTVLGLFLLLFVAGFVIERPLRGLLERKANAALKGYTVRIGAAHLHLWDLSLALPNTTVLQQAHPDPPVAHFENFRFSVQWRNLFRWKIVADLVIDHPNLHIDMTQLKAEAKDPEKFKDHGWQQAVEAMYPLKINEVRIYDGALRFIADAKSKPLDMGRANVVLRDIRNVRSVRGDYPSEISGTAVLFGQGKVRFDGHADFLAEPFAGFKVVAAAENIPLDQLDPISKDFHLRLRGGVLGLNGLIEYAPKVQIMHLQELSIGGLHVDYVSTAATKGEEKKQTRAAANVAKEASNKPRMLLKIDRLRLENGDFGFVNDSADPPFRIFVSRTDMTLTNLSNQFREGAAVFKASGLFMGHGRTDASGTFRPDYNGADFDLDMKMVDTPLPTLNNVLRAYAKFDVAAGDLSVFVQVRVKNGYIDGYVKPLFKNIKVYDKEKDKDKPFLKKLYEHIVQGLANLLRNRPREEVATVATFSGPTGNAKASNLEVLVKLIQNAFFRAILPGFEREVKLPFAGGGKDERIANRQKSEDRGERTGSASGKK